MSVSEHHSSITEFLLNVESSGKELRETFISECAVDPNQFEKPIKRNKISTFANALKKKKKITIHGKVQEIRL